MSVTKNAQNIATFYSISRHKFKKINNQKWYNKIELKGKSRTCKYDDNITSTTDLLTYLKSLQTNYLVHYFTLAIIFIFVLHALENVRKKCNRLNDAVCIFPCHILKKNYVDYYLLIELNCAHCVTKCTHNNFFSLLTASCC